MSRGSTPRHAQTAGDLGCVAEMIFKVSVMASLVVKITCAVTEMTF